MSNGRVLSISSASSYRVATAGGFAWQSALSLATYCSRLVLWPHSGRSGRTGRVAMSPLRVYVCSAAGRARAAARRIRVGTTRPCLPRRQGPASRPCGRSDPHHWPVRVLALQPAPLSVRRPVPLPGRVTWPALATVCPVVRLPSFCHQASR